MSIAEKITRLNTAKNDIATAITNKGVTVAETDGFEEYPALIDSIEAGGGGGTAVAADVLSGKTFCSDAGTDIVGTMPIYNDFKIVVDNPSISTEQKFIKYVCGGANGKSYYSTDGTTWTAMSGIVNAIRGLTYGKGIYVAAQDGGISKSTNGISWTNVSGTPSYMKSLVFNEVFVGSHTNGTYYSEDGESWSKITGYSGGIHALGYGRMFVGALDSGYTCYSSDGKTWSFNSSTINSTSYRRIVYGGGRYVLVGGTSYYSTDGNQWYPISTISGLSDVAYGNNKFVAVGYDGKSYYSTNGTTWTAISGLDTSKTYNCVTYGDEKFMTMSTGKPYIYNGSSWSASTAFDNSTNYAALIAAKDSIDYLTYTIPAGYHSAQKIMLKKA